ncbi:hypothetical protein [Treponema peruense]|uniref:hypothetical protein n=1 Tax=Treponema peruense TaxID=2787628 RepID=UPI0039EF5694
MQDVLQGVQGRGCKTYRKLKMRGEKTECGFQYFLDFDFYEQEEKKEIDDLLFFAAPENDNQRLMNLQYEYYHGMPEKIDKIFLLLLEIARKIISKEAKEKKLIFCIDHKEELAVDSASLVIEQILKNRLKIRTSFIAYLYLQVKKTMYSKTKAQKLEDYCIKNNINFFLLSEDEKRKVKRNFEEYKKEGRHE